MRLVPARSRAARWLRLVWALTYPLYLLLLISGLQGGLVIPILQSVWLLPLSLVTLLFSNWPRATRQMLFEAAAVLLWGIAAIWMVSGRYPDPAPRPVGGVLWAAAVLFPWVVIVRARWSLARIVAPVPDGQAAPGRPGR